MKTENVDSPQAVAGQVDCRVRPHWEATPLALFAGPTYYPSPGFKSFVGLFSSLEDAEREGKKHAEDAYGWWQVVDLFTLNIVAGEGKGHSGLFGPVSAA